MICVPITSKKINEAISDINKSSKKADLIELRLDLISEVNKANISLFFHKKTKKLPFICTDRKNRLSLIKKCIELGCEYVDIDVNELKLIEKVKKIIKERYKKTKLIISYHNFKDTPKKIDRIYDKIKKINSDVIKIATTANSIMDNLIIFDLLKNKKNKKPLIALCMGEAGEISRILNLKYGSFLTYAALIKGKESAPGQIDLDNMADVYDATGLNDDTKIYGLVGNPVNKSKGYLIHNSVFMKLGMNSIYVNFLADDLGEFIENYKGLFFGLSVTMPFKEKIVKYLDDADKAAKKIGAVNTVVNKNGKLIGYNTDCGGAIESIKKISIIKNKKILLIGAGGVAKAIAFGILEEMGQLAISNRTEEKGKRLAKEIGCNYVSLSDIKHLKNIDIFINCTSLGMHPNVDDAPIDSLTLKKIMSKNGIVFDSVYNPANTQLIKEARAIGLKTINGLDFFINQAALQFRLWTGKEMQIEYALGMLLK